MLERKIVDKIIGKGFADKLDEPVFFLGPKEISRRIMVEELGCANFVAAVNLGKVLKRLKIETPAQLFRTNPMDLARARSIGEAALFVAMCLLDAAEYDVEKWWGWKETNDVKFSSFKHNAIKRARRNGHEV